MDIISKFGKPGSTDLSSAFLKELRFQNVTAVCQPQSFMGARFKERESQMRLLDGFLFKPRNIKGKRNLITAIASSGMGKSAFIDEYCRLIAGNEYSCIHPIAISYNTKQFGKTSQEDDVDLAARLLMSYFVSNPTTDLLDCIATKLSNISRIFTAVNMLESVVSCIKDDLQIQSGARKSKILIACDEVGKSKDEQQVVGLLCSLIDDDDDLECFFTGLNLNPFSKESSAGRFLKYVPLPLLTVTSSLELVQSFVKGSQSLKVSSKLAHLSGGHPRTINIFETVIAENKWCDMNVWSDSMIQTVVDSTTANQSRGLSEPEIMLLLRPRTSMSDILNNADLKRALGEGKLYATIFNPDEKKYVELFTSPLLLRSSLLIQAALEKNALIDNLNEMLALVGLRDLTEFRRANAQQNGKTFENFFLRMEMVRRGFQESQLCKDEIKVAKLYPTVTYQQNCDDVNFKLAGSYDVLDISCQSDFPSSNPADAAVLKAVKALIDSVPINNVVRPEKKDQAAFDFFILKGVSGTRYVQLIEPTFSAGGPNPDEFFTKRYLKKLKAAESLPWNELGIDLKNLIHTFVSTGNTSGTEWKTMFDNAGYSDRRVLILDRTDLSTFYGPTLNVLFSSCFSD